jgi:hypothetical protein
MLHEVRIYNHTMFMWFHKGGLNHPQLWNSGKNQIDKIQVKILTFSGRICLIKYLYLWNDNHFCKIQSISIQFGLRILPDPPFFPKLSMTVQINHKKLYYNYYNSGKFLTLKFKFQVKSSAPPPPATSVRNIRESVIKKDNQ